MDGSERQPDREVLRQRLQFVRDALGRLEEIRDHGEEDFLSSHLLQDAAVRNLQVGIEALLDSANHVIARQGLGIPRTYQDAIDLLVKHGVLPREKADDFSRMVRFRNRAVHLYDQIAPSEIWKILQHHLGDFEIFIRAVVQRYMHG